MNRTPIRLADGRELIYFDEHDESLAGSEQGPVRV